MGASAEMARWGRSLHFLTVKPGARVLDLGCAFGYGTGLLARKYQVEGLDLSSDYIDRAKRRVPRARFTCGSAESLPYGDGAFDAVVVLDVLEHLPDQDRVVREVARVMQKGGELIVSVPSRGVFWWLDSLNLYASLFGTSGPPPTVDPSWSRYPHHRHYTLSQLKAVLSPSFQIEAWHYSGIGLAELINLCLLIIVRRWLGWVRLYGLLQFVYFGAYIVEDEFSLGSASYHLMVRARRVE